VLLRRQCCAKRRVAGADNNYVGRFVCHLSYSGS
jgi:hypothetical protein